MKLINPLNTHENCLNNFDLKRASDYVTYITMLSRLAKLLENENNFNVYVAVIKNWISEFQVRLFVTSLSLILLKVKNLQVGVT